MAKPTIADAALELLTDRRAATTEEITEFVVARGLARAKDPVRGVRSALEESHVIRRLDDGRWSSLLVLLDGVRLTHELSAAEAEAGALAVDADLAPIWSIRSRLE